MMVALVAVGCAPELLRPVSETCRTPTAIESAWLARAEAGLDRLRPSYSGPLVVRVCDSEKVGAYSWSDGTVYLTSSLLVLLTDDEVSAVIAHELGHLAHVEGGCQGFALGGPRNADEEQADAVGVMLLRTSGIPPGALGRALAKVRDAHTTPEETRRAMAARIALLPS
jgi:Zn-dependent protease with chaperone function